MEIGPVWRSMLRNKGGFILIALQIAVTMTIMVNAVAIIRERSADMARPSGVDELNTFSLSSVAFVEGANLNSLIREDLDLIRNQPGVISATVSNSFPLSQGGWSEGISDEPGQDDSDTSAAIYFVDEQGLESFGLNLIDGKDFTPEQVDWVNWDEFAWPPVTVVSRALAADLFPDADGSYVGRTMYLGDDDPVTIIGVVETLQAPWSSWTGVERSILVPRLQGGEYSTYIVRTEPGSRDELMASVEQLLSDSNRDRIIRSVRSFEESKKLAYLAEDAINKMLGFVVLLLTVITGLGIVGLASFNVSRRTRQIGIRRALGATRPAIVRHFMVENFLVSTIGVVVGGILAVALNMVMVESFSIRPMAWYVVPLAMVVLWTVGQVAVAGPARRASNISPAIATRSG